MKLLQSLYYRFNAWRYGRSYGCGRCHHPEWFHYRTAPASRYRDKIRPCNECGCPDYSIERLY